jgi:hypothetical protein
MALNKRQKSIIYNSIFVVVFTITTVFGMIHLKDHVNRKEAIRAMEQLGKICIEYRSENKMVPSTHYIEKIKKQLEGSARAGAIIYRGRWISFGAKDDEILAYSQKKYSHSFIKSGYIVLRLDGTVEWMGARQFEELLSSQQSPEEKRFEK